MRVRGCALSEVKRKDREETRWSRLELLRSAERKMDENEGGRQSNFSRSLIVGDAASHHHSLHVHETRGHHTVDTYRSI